MAKKEEAKIKTADDFELANGYTIGDYSRMKLENRRKDIADLIYKRFSERYLIPLGSIRHGQKSGFCMMAIACLTIEALESFQQGWPDTKGKGNSPFCSFFDHYEAFAQLRGHGAKFYQHVRCGILHQAETTGGWRIRRDKNGLLFNADSLVINANAFLKALNKSLQDYRDALKNEEKLDSKLWENAIKKMDTICSNCDIRASNH